MSKVAFTCSLIGPSNTGKTTLIKSYQSEEGEIYPTAGFEINFIQVGLKPVLVYDCSGEGNLKNWDKFSILADGVVFVIDAADSGRFARMKRSLYRFL